MFHILFWATFVIIPHNSLLVLEFTIPQKCAVGFKENRKNLLPGSEEDFSFQYCFSDECMSTIQYAYYKEGKKSYKYPAPDGVVSIYFTAKRRGACFKDLMLSQRKTTKAGEQILWSRYLMWDKTFIHKARVVYVELSYRVTTNIALPNNKCAYKALTNQQENVLVLQGRNAGNCMQLCLTSGTDDGDGSCVWGIFWGEAEKKCLFVTDPHCNIQDDLVPIPGTYQAIPKSAMMLNDMFYTYGDEYLPNCANGYDGRDVKACDPPRANCRPETCMLNKANRDGPDTTFSKAVASKLTSQCIMPKPPGSIPHQIFGKTCSDIFEDIKMKYISPEESLPICEELDGWQICGTVAETGRLHDPKKPEHPPEPMWSKALVGVITILVDQVPFGGMVNKIVSALSKANGCTNFLCQEEEFSPTKAYEELTNYVDQKIEVVMNNIGWNEFESALETAYVLFDQKTSLIQTVVKLNPGDADYNHLSCKLEFELSSFNDLMISSQKRMNKYLEEVGPKGLLFYIRFAIIHVNVNALLYSTSQFSYPDQKKFWMDTLKSYIPLIQRMYDKYTSVGEVTVEKYAGSSLSGNAPTNTIIDSTCPEMKASIPIGGMGTMFRGGVDDCNIGYFQEYMQAFTDFCVWKYKDDTKAAKMDFWYPEAGKALEHFKKMLKKLEKFPGRKPFQERDCAKMEPMETMPIPIKSKMRDMEDENQRKQRKASKQIASKPIASKAHLSNDDYRAQQMVTSSRHSRLQILPYASHLFAFLLILYMLYSFQKLCGRKDEKLTEHLIEEI